MKEMIAAIEFFSSLEMGERTSRETWRRVVWSFRDS
jgi:hypothetical protein